MHYGVVFLFSYLGVAQFISSKGTAHATSCSCVSALGPEHGPGYWHPGFSIPSPIGLQVPNAYAGVSSMVQIYGTLSRSLLEKLGAF